jgi:ATP-dependent exoDNAse (exonuclease V) beta subunit
VNDTAARDRILSDLDTTLFVEAAAGTGKTTALVGRLVSLLRSGRGTLERVVALTFTEKAAGEMKLRLRAEIERARAALDARSQERVRLDGALEQLELARIMTIHAFCADLLHERPIEAGVDPLCEVADEEESGRLLDRAFDAWFQGVLSDPPEGVRRILRRRPRRRDEEGPREQLRRAVGGLVEHRDFAAAWRRDPAFDRDTGIDALLRELAELGELAGRASRADDWLAQNLRRLGAFAQEAQLLERVRGGRDHDELESELWRLARDTGSTRAGWSWKGSPRTRWSGDLDRDAVLARRDAVKQRLDALLVAAEADLAACLREELRPAVRAYEVLKARAGKLDFLDLLVRARDLIRGHAGVRAELQHRFTHFFVDEFQDTDPVQAELILLLAADDPGATDWRRVAAVPGKLFIVGDPKQSIYRFRRADVMTYEAVKRQLAAAGAEVLQLTTSFRALPALQEAVNAAFAPAIAASPDGSQAAYVPLERARPAFDAQPALVALPVPRPYTEYGKLTQWSIEASCPDAVGAFVAWLVTRSGWTVEDPLTRQRVPIQARHVCLLFRRFKRFGDDVTRPYVRALEVRRIPHVLVGGRSFHGREEVQAIRNALAAIEWPDDELRVYATLRGPLFALGDDALLAYRYRVGGHLHTLRRHEPELLARLDAPERAVAESLELLGALHRGRNHRPIADTLARLLAALRVHAGIANWPTGEQALANCLRTLDVARRFESRGASSFRAFVEYLDDQAEHGEAQDAPVVEEGTEGVRIMSVHKAKGLEFPVVVLADPTCHLVGRHPTRHVDAARGLWAEPLCGCVPHDLRDAEALERRHDREEAVRLAYVAATRARDLLIVPTIGDLGDRPDERWLEMLDPVLYPRFDARRESLPAPGCPAFGEDSVVERPESSGKGTSASVRPGLVRPDAGTHAVTWWDPRALELDVEEDVGLRQQKILQADEGGVRSDAGIRAHAQWQARRSETLARGSAESIRLARVVDLAAERVALPGRAGVAETGAGATGAGPRLEELAVERGRRPGGKRFGTLVHAVLAVVDLEADPVAVATAARAQGRILGAAQVEVEAAAQAACAALAHPLLRRAAQAAERGDLRRETPVLLRLDDGRLAEGVVDLAFREKSQAGALWTVVDFKTDRELAARRLEYETQVGLYARAITRATGEAAEAVLLVV